MECSAQLTHIRKVLSVLVFLTATGIFFCTLWPFDPLPPNQVSWLPDANAIRFQHRGVVLSDSSRISPAATSSSRPCSVELWIKPSQTDSVSTILNVYQSGNPWRFLVRQYVVGLIISHDVLSPSGKPKRIKVDVDDGLHANRLLFITITSGEDGTSVYFDGHLKKFTPYFHIAAADLDGQLILGSSTVQPDAWAGELHGVALYSRELTLEQVAESYRTWQSGQLSRFDTQTIAAYSFGERAGNTIHDLAVTKMDLSIPGIYRVPHHSFLTRPWDEFDPSWDYFWDVVRNVVGFVPFGFFLCGLLVNSSRRQCDAVLYATLSGFALSVCVEILQAYIPERGSGMTDILTNSLGTFVGALLARTALFEKLS